MKRSARVVGLLVLGCTAFQNGDDGIVTGGGSSVTNCTTGSNGGDGIEVNFSALVSGNVCHNNYQPSESSIHTIGAGNRIEGNVMFGNNRGMAIDVLNNVIIRNTACNNTTNYQIVADNKAGPIVVPPNRGAISGNTGGAGVGTTDTWGNPAY